MKFCHTFWSKPLLENKFYNITDTLKYLLYHYACSVEYVKQSGYNIVLYTDTYGKELFGFLPYDDIIILDEPEVQNKHFAAQFKFEALKRMNLDDVLIDGDIIIRNPVTYEKILNYNEDVIYSFYEPTEMILCSEDKKYMTKSLLDDLSEFSFSGIFNLPDYNAIAYPNTSFLKFNNQELKDKYISQYYYHLNMIKDKEFEHWPDIILEQFFLKCLIDANNYTYRQIIPDYPSEESESYAVNIQFAHIGAEKFETLDLVKHWLKACNYNMYNIVTEKTEKLIEQYK